MIINQVVSGGGSTGNPYSIAKRVSTIGGKQTLINGNSIIDLTGVEVIYDWALAYAYYNNTDTYGMNANFSSVETINDYGMYNCFASGGVGDVNLSSLTQICQCGMQEAFSNAIISGDINLSSLTTIDAEGMSDCFYGSNLTSLNLPSLVNIGYNGMYDCFVDSELGDIYFPVLDTVESEGLAYAFQGTSLTEITFPSLTTIETDAFIYAFSSSAIQNIRFPALISANEEGIFAGMLDDCEDVEVHFTMAIQNDIENWQEVLDGFNGTNTSVLFDIVSSFDGDDNNTYNRSEKDSFVDENDNIITAWDYNGTLYYTEGLEPSVSDNVYSDSDCTNVVTTITAIY